MRILSNFKDYYDGLQTPGETEPLYVRRTEEKFNLPQEAFEGMKCQPERRYYVQNGPFDISNEYLRINQTCYEINYVGFCGKLYLALTRYYYPNPSGYPLQLVPNVYLTPERLLGGLNEKDLKVAHNALIMKGVTIKDEIYTIYSQFPKTLTSWQFENLAPVFVASQTRRDFWNFCENPKLATLGFASIVPPFEAFQELDMFLSNRANPEKDVKPIADQLLLQQKGFDSKTSFRHPVK